MKRLLSMIVLSSIAALAMWGTRRTLSSASASRNRRTRHVPRQPLETWEGEGGNLSPHETRSLQQQLG
jgi:hypothetical protein